MIKIEPKYYKNITYLSLAERKLPTIEEFDDELKVLDPNISVADKIFLFYIKTPQLCSN